MAKCNQPGTFINNLPNITIISNDAMENSQWITRWILVSVKARILSRFMSRRADTSDRTTQTASTSEHHLRRRHRFPPTTTPTYTTGLGERQMGSTSSALVTSRSNHGFCLQVRKYLRVLFAFKYTSWINSFTVQEFLFNNLVWVSLKLHARSLFCLDLLYHGALSRVGVCQSSYFLHPSLIDNFLWD